MTHFLAAKTICAFLSRKLASLRSGVSSHAAFPPGSRADDDASLPLRRSSRWKRVMRLSLAVFEDDATEAATACPAVCVEASVTPADCVGYSS